ncbi:MAG: phosphoribosyl-ATP diphosphatase [Nanoarchaeota archaeon]|nr:phosphoribosyl-ATP diphosphatase [Nanoarchaeota archaeon]
MRSKEIATALGVKDNKLRVMRGEDIPCFVDLMSKQGKRVAGITGEDLFKEYTLDNNSSLKILKRFKWEDSSALFGKPVLCLLGPKGKNMDDLSKSLKVSINKKYVSLAKSFLRRLENKGFNFEKIYFSGSTEDVFSQGISDLVIDIVYSGKSAEVAGLKVYDKIFESDIVLIGKEQEKFGFNELYSIILKRINGKNENSFTYKLIKNQLELNRKIIEESGEVVTARDKENLIWEIADLIYFLFVKMAGENISIKDIEKELQRKNEEKLLNKDKLNRIKEARK